MRVSLYEGTKYSTATYLKGLGADDRLLASIMGHTDVRSVEKYAKVQGQGQSYLEKAGNLIPDRQGSFIVPK